jgi:uncharacterized protein (DUF2141 family)
MKSSILICLFCVLSLQQVEKHTINLHIHNIRNNAGVLQIAVFENEKEFKTESPSHKFIVKKSKLKNENLNIQIQLKAGIYGICILDDEDESGHMTYKIGFYPIEGVGFANYHLKRIKKPKFSDFCIEVIEDIDVSIEMRYF